MAQAARLNLRMQKELKLLLTDPPPGASFPLLTGNSSGDSFSTIDAHIEGPEGTVYAKGVFHIKIQIPERYPFQPPSVTFATPIYHPNIDNGGRICLDILNLPPKGAWKPSLNISTVLTSIGLLLSEPNPDDGLMCEVSKEYKCNRQAFDQKARSMTQKYAKAGACGSSSGSQSILTNSNPKMIKIEGPDNGSKYEVNENTVSHERLGGISQKLSLESSGSTQKKNADGEVSEVPNRHLYHSNFENQMQIEGPKESSKCMVDEYNPSPEKLSGRRHKLSLESLGPSQKNDGDDKKNVLPNHVSSLLNPKSLSTVSLEFSSVLQTSNCYKQQPHQDGDSKSIIDGINTSSEKMCWDGQKLLLESLDTCLVSDGNNQLLPSQSLSNMQYEASQMPDPVNHNELHPLMDSVDRMGNGSTNTNCKKLCLAGKKLSLGFKSSSQRHEKDNKENVVPFCNLPLPQPQGLSTAPSKSLPVPQDCSCYGKQQSNQDHEGKVTVGIKQQRREESPILDAVIVLDSEDSEEEGNGCLRSKLPLARKRLARKWRAKE